MTIDIKLPLQELISKSAVDSNSLPNSVMTRQQANMFIDLLVDESVLLKNIRVERVDHNKGEVNKLDLATIVTQGAHTTGKASTHTPTESVMTYDCVKYRSAFDLKTDFTEDNLEGSAIRDKLLNMFSKRMAIDTEMASIEGDDDLPVGDNETAENNLLGVNDGFSKILRAEVAAGRKIDANGKAPTKQLYYDMRRAVPARYRVARPEYRWIVPSGPADKWGLDWSDRETQGGDRALTSELTDMPGPWGNRMLEVPLMPEDLTYGTAGTAGSEIWYTPLANLVFFIQRDITIEWERKPRQDMWEATIHYRCDFEVENPDLVVLAQNVDLTGADYTG